MKRFFLLPVLFVWIGVSALGQTRDEYRQQVASLVATFRWDAARTLLQQGLERFSADAYLLVLAAALHARAGDFEKADPLLERALRSDLSGDQLRLAAGIRLQQGERIAARQLLERALRLDPSDSYSRYQLAYVLLADGEPEEALAQIAEAVRLDPRDARLRHFYALVLDRVGRSDDAYAQLREAQRAAPGDARLLLRLSDREKSRGRLEQALEYLDLAAEVDPENPLYPAQSAELYDRLGRTNEARDRRARADELEAAFDAYVEALQLAGSDRADEAIALLAPVVADHPEFQTAALFLGQLYRRDGKQEKALKLYLELLQADPARSEAREEMAWIRAQDGQLEAALEVLEAGSARSLNALLLEGHRSLQAARWSEAMGYFRQVEQFYPLDPKLLQLISFSLNEMGDVEEALGYLEKANRIVPADPTIRADARAIRARYGLDRIEAREWDKAEAAFRQLAREQPSEPQHRLRLAYSLQGQGKTDEAIAQYERGLGMSPGEDWARVNFAACLYAVGRQSEATDQWRYLVVHSNSPEYVYNLGLSLIRELKLEEGWSLVERAAGEGHPPARRLMRRAGRL